MEKKRFLHGCESKAGVGRTGNEANCNEEVANLGHLHVYVYIIEYGSTLYVGMAQKKNGGPIKRVQNLMFRTLLWM